MSSIARSVQFARVSRRPDSALVSLLLPLMVFVAFGAFRVDAPISLIGLLFDQPWQFALVATVFAFGGAALLFVPAIELRVAGSFVADAREPTAAERARLERLLARIGERSGIDTSRLVLRVQDSGELNAAAGAVRLLCVTDAALGRSDAELEALLAHEVGHHRGLHPLATTIVWWLSLPGELLAAVYRLLRRLATRLRVGPVVLVAQLLLLVWQVAVMWLYYVGELLAQWAARGSEYVADRAAAEWGYGPQLVALYREVGDEPRRGLLARLLAEHPPIEARIERLGSGA
jgi:Zn-dependent protease with chaperone function